MNDKRHVERLVAGVMCENRLATTTTSNANSDCATMVGPNFRVGKKIGCGNFGELRLGEYDLLLYWFCTVEQRENNTSFQFTAG